MKGENKVECTMLPNPRHERFAEAYVRSGNAAESWRIATGRTKDADVHGAEFMGKHGIRERITEIRAEMEQGFKMNREEWLQRLKANADESRAAKDRTAERQALREIGLAMAAWYAPERKEAAVTTTISTPTAEALLSNPDGLAAITRRISSTPEGREAMRRALERTSVGRAHA